MKNKKFNSDFLPIEKDCECLTCKNYTKAFLHTVVTKETTACHLISIHNVYYQLNLMKNMRESIKRDDFESFVNTFMYDLYGNYENIPLWVVEALEAVKININKIQSNF